MIIHKFNTSEFYVLAIEVAFFPRKCRTYHDPLVPRKTVDPFARSPLLPSILDHLCNSSPLIQFLQCSIYDHGSTSVILVSHSPCLNTIYCQVSVSPFVYACELHQSWHKNHKLQSVTYSIAQRLTTFPWRWSGEGSIIARAMAHSLLLKVLRSRWRGKVSSTLLHSLIHAP